MSCDTQFTHLAWQQNEKELKNAKFSMGADTTGDLAKAFGIYIGDAGLPLRGTYLINPEGVLMNSEVNFLNMGRNIDETLRKLRANMYLGEHGDQGCPARWTQEGDKTLTPGPHMVGKVHEALNN